MADERLEIQIQAKVDKAVSGLTKLVDKLNDTKKSLNSVNGSGLSNFASGLDKLSNATISANGVNKTIKNIAKAINEMATATKSVSDVGNISKITQNLATSLNNLSNINIGNSVAQTTNAIARLVTALSQMNSADVSEQNIENVSKAVRTLTDSLQSMGATADISNFANSLGVLVSALNKVKSVTGVQDTLKGVGSALNDVVKKFQGVSVSSELALFTFGLGNIAKNSTKATTSLTKIKNKLDELSGSTNNATEKTKSFLQRLQTFNSGVGQVTSAFGTIRNTIQGVVNAVNKLLDATSDYVETFNYFNVTIGKINDEFGESGEIGNYASALNDLTAKMTGYTIAEDGAISVAEGVNLGQSITQIMKFESQIASITNATGMLGDTSIRTSKAMTMLAVDLSSLWNIDVESAMTNLRSGLVGQTKALYKYGIDITNANLQQLAYTLGVEKSVQAMTQAEKMQLRVISILQQSKVAWGDQANTVSTYANQSRILTEQLKNTGMQIGAILLPIAQKVLIFFNAVLIAFRNIIQGIMSFFGFKWSNVLDGISDGYSALSEDMEDLDTGVESVGTSLDNANSSAKELKKTLLGFDEINALNDNGTTGTLGGIGGGGVGGSDLDLSDALKDATEDYFKVWENAYKNANNMAQKLAEKMQTVLKIALAIGSAFLGWKIASKILNALGIMERLKIKAGRVSFGIILSITGFSIETASAFNIGKEGANLGNVLGTLIGGSLGTIGATLITTGLGLGAGVGLAIAIPLAVTLALTGIYLGWREGQKEKWLKENFGTLVLSEDEIQRWADKLTLSTKIAVSTQYYIKEKDNLKTLKDDLNTALQNLNMTNLKVGIGIGVDESDLQSSIDDMLSSAKAYLEQSQSTNVFAIQMMLGENSNVEKAVNTFYSDNEVKLNELGAKLKEVVAQGFKDGKWIDDYKEQAEELQRQINEVLAEMEKHEYELNMSKLKLKAEDSGYSLESLEGVVSKALESTQEILAGQEDMFYTTKANLEQSYAQGLITHNAYLNELETNTQTYLDNIEESWKDSLTFINEYITKNFDVGIQQVEEKMSNFDFRKWLVQTTGSDTIAQDILNNANEYANKMLDAYKGSMESVSPALRDSAKDAIEQLTPTREELEKSAKEYEKAGKQIPQSIREGITNIKEVEALAGDLDAQKYMLGKQLSTDQSWLKLLETSKNAGKDIDENIRQGLTNNAQFVYDASTNTIQVLADGMTTTLDASKPEILQNLKDLGVKFSDSFETMGKNSKESSVFKLDTETKSVLNKIKKAIENGDKSALYEHFNSLDEESKKSVFFNAPRNVQTMISDMETTVDGADTQYFKGHLDLTKTNADLSDFWSLGANVGAEVGKGIANVNGKDTDYALKHLNSAKSKSDNSTIYGLAKNILGVVNNIIAQFSGANTTFIQSMLNKSRTSANTSSIFSLPSLIQTNVLNPIVSAFSGTILKFGGIDLPTVQGAMVGASAGLGASFQVSSYIQHYASGGYDINSGEMFIARENGLTEMVGRIGTHTTVANNQQIVEGISVGVANANATQNALLQEQNNLLRELIAKAGQGGNTTISTSEIVSALERTNTRNGRTIVALGV